MISHKIRLYELNHHPVLEDKELLSKEIGEHPMLLLSLTENKAITILNLRFHLKGKEFRLNRLKYERMTEGRYGNEYR